MKKSLKIILVVIIFFLLLLGILLFHKNNTFDVIFYNDNEVYETVSVKKYKTMNKIEQPTKDGYIFLGWYDEIGNMWNYNEQVYNDMVLFARWGKITSE